METQICIIGAGPAGLMAAISAAEAGAAVCIIESNPSAGSKLLKTGRGRCNITHLAAPGEILKAYDKYEKFLRHAIYEFTPQMAIDFFEQHGVATKIEKAQGVWPVSDKASDVKEALVGAASAAKVRFIYGRKVEKVEREGGRFACHFRDGVMYSQALIIATGGASWPGTGSCGDGFAFAKSLGHTIVVPKPALVPLNTVETWLVQLAGIPLGAITCTAKINGQKVSATGEALFTHHGIGGPGVFDFSRLIIDAFTVHQGPMEITVDLLPDISGQELETKIDQWCEKRPKQSLITMLSEMLPKAVAEAICSEFKFDPAIQASQFSKASRRKLTGIIKSLPLHVKSTRPLAEATVTRGGVDIKELDPKTMQSRLVRGLFFAGEVMDVDGPCGGYNLQIAYSTGTLAGKNAAQTHVE